MTIELISSLPQVQTHASPLLLIHGAWHGAWCWWEHFMEYFSGNGYPVYAFSMRGHGASDGRKGLRWASIAGYVEDLTHIVAQMDAPPVLVGHSMGGFVLQKYLEMPTVTPPAAVLLSSIPPTGALGALLRLTGRHPLAVLKTFVRLSPYQLVATPALARENFFSPNLPEADLRRYFPQIQEESFRAFLDMVLLTRIKTARVHTPLLVMGAEGDKIFTTGEVKATARAYHTDPVIFANTAHDVMLEENWPVVAETILEWLAVRGI